MQKEFQIARTSILYDEAVILATCLHFLAVVGETRSVRIALLVKTRSNTYKLALIFELQETGILFCLLRLGNASVSLGLERLGKSERGLCIICDCCHSGYLLR